VPNCATCGRLEDHVAFRGDLFFYFSVELHILCRGSVRFSGMNVNDGRSRFPCLICCFCDLIRCDRKSRLLFSRNFCTSQAGRNNKFFHFFVLLNYALRCLSLGTTHVPLALQVTIGSASTSAAESLMSVLAMITFRASNTIFLEVFPTLTISPTASM